ncbi:hypothetical protein BSKO_02296 [Bryopsis sp. KO-2023]|nr:hypothetical protein BSKO_02296 [Bryopsis sp. KO-2023]
MSHEITEDATKALYGLISEFLQFHDFPLTLEAFAAERTCKRQQLASSLSGRLMPGGGSDIKKKMLESFDAYQRDDFFELWNRIVPVSFQQQNQDAQKMEFQLNLHFAVYGVNHGEEITKEALVKPMHHLRHFLEEKGGSLAHSNEFLPFYALPYVSQPWTHPTFSHLFEKSWKDDLRSNLTDFLESVPEEISVPRLYQTCWQQLTQGEENTGQESTGSDGNSETDAESHRSRDTKNGTFPEESNQDQASTVSANDEGDSEYSSIDNSAAEGSGLDPSDATSPNPRVSMRKDANIAALTVSISDMGGQGGIIRDSMIWEDGNGNCQDSALPSPSEGEVQSTLDFGLLKTDMQDGPDELVMRIMQAFRSQLVQCRTSTDFFNHIQLIASNDLLNCQTPGPSGTMLEAAVARQNSLLTEELARFINVLATDLSGRMYLLLPSANTIGLLHDILSDEICTPSESPAGPRRSGDATKDTAVHQYALASLQKLSWSRKGQDLMIEMGILEWVIDWLEDLETVSEFSLEYGTALVMNLALHAKGKAKCEELMHKLLPLLENLLECDNPQVRTYVNGTLYSILGLLNIRVFARTRGLDELLKAVASRSGETFARQIDYIMEQLMADEDFPGTMSDDDADDETAERGWDPDVFKDENDDLVLLGSENDEPRGEGFLQARYGIGLSLGKSSPEGSGPSPHPPRRSLTSISTPLEPTTLQRRSLMGSPMQELPLNRPATPKLVPSSVMAGHGRMIRASVQRKAQEAATMVKYRLLEKNESLAVEPSPMEYIQAFSVTRELPRTPNHPNLR